MEKFKREDIIKYRYLDKNLIVGDELLNISCGYDMKHINIPNKLFTKIIKEKRPEFVKYLPYDVTIKKLEPNNNIWLKDTNYLGLNSGNNLELQLNPKVEHSVVSLLWLLLHEFRHKLQHNLSYLKTNVDNDNYEKWVNHYDYELNSVLHVFHEIIPYEIDANTFACELLEIDYPSSKFKITKETLKRLIKK